MLFLKKFRVIFFLLSEWMNRKSKSKKMDKTFHEYIKRLKLWKDCMSGETRNSIINQLSMMLWNMAVFKMINEARKIAVTNEKGDTEVNVMIHNLINNCFFESQMMAIRRLADDHYLIEGNRAIYSIVSLLKDLKKYRNLLTRENLIRESDMDYDYEKMQIECDQFINDQIRKGIECSSIPKHLDWHRIERRHKEIDVLTDKKRGNRSRCDYVSKKIINRFIKKIKKTSNQANKIVNKYIAHSASLADQKQNAESNIKITLENIGEAQRVLCQIVAFIDTYLISRVSHVGFLPIPQYDQFKYIEKSLISSERVNILKKKWKEFQKETEEWCHCSLDGI